MTFDDPYARGAQQGSWQPVATNPYPVDERATGARQRGVDPALVFGIVGIVLLGILAVLVGGYMLLAVGAGAALIASIMALVPLALVLITVGWIDRWEPEPRLALAFALLWGAAAAIAIALIFSFVVQVLEMSAGVEASAGTMFFSAVIQAPIVEEFGKGLGVLIIFWVFRRNFDGPVDGLVYGALVGVGFAFTENIQYFGLALSGSDLAGVSEIFFLRAILSPFAHVMFTSCTGLALGLASRRMSAVGAIGYFLLGLIPAILLHAFWNGASFVVTNFYAYYTVVQVPLFLIAISIVVFLRRRERQITADRLEEYARVGWFSQAEVGLLSSAAGRNAGRAWASRHGLGPQFQKFVKDATRLAFARQRVISSRDRIGANRAEADLLQEITADRRALVALPPMPMQPGPMRSGPMR